VALQGNVILVVENFLKVEKMIDVVAETPVVVIEMAAVTAIESQNSHAQSLKINS
jgi:hypothetical protein